jgi:hypothetical protein
MKSFLFGSFSALLLAAAIAPIAHAQTTTTPDAPRTNAPTDSGLTVPEQLQQQQQTPQGDQPSNIDRSNTGDRTPNAPRTNAPTDSGLTVPEQLQQQQPPQGNQPSNTLENRTPNAPRTNAPTDSGLTVPEQLQQQEQTPQGGSSTQYRQEQQQYRGTQQQQYNSPNRQTPNNTDGSVRTAPQTTNQGTGASGSGQYVPGLW